MCIRDRHGTLMDVNVLCLCACVGACVCFNYCLSVLLLCHSKQFYGDGSSCAFLGCLHMLANACLCTQRENEHFLPVFPVCAAALEVDQSAAG